VAAAGAALLPLAISQQGSDQTDWFNATPLAARAWQIPVHFASIVKPDIPSPHAWVTVLQVAAAASATILALGGAALLVRRGGRSERRGALVAAGLGAASFAIPFAVAAAGLDFVDARNLVGTLVLLLVAAGIAFGSLRVPVAGTAALVAMCVIFGGLLGATATTPVMQRPNWRGDANAIGNARVKRLVVVPRTFGPPLSYYLHAQDAEGLARPVWVREIELFSSAPTKDAPRAPFRLIAERSVRHGLWVARYRSSHPARVWLSPDRARRMIGQGPGALVTVPPIRAAAPQRPAW
jgi:hypothetical protein